MIELSAINGSAGVAQVSPPIDLGDRQNYSVHAIFTGANTGILKLVASDTRDIGYVDIKNGSVALDDCDFLFNVQLANYRYFKVLWTPSVAPGTISVKVTIKEEHVKEG